MIHVKNEQDEAYIKQKHDFQKVIENFFLKV